MCVDIKYFTKTDENLRGKHLRRAPLRLPSF